MHLKNRKDRCRYEDIHPPLINIQDLYTRDKRKYWNDHERMSENRIAKQAKMQKLSEKRSYDD